MTPAKQVITTKIDPEMEIILMSLKEKNRKNKLGMKTLSLQAKGESEIY